MPTEITGKRLSARGGILLIGIYLTLDAEAGFEPARTLWALRAYETRELDRATLLRDKWQVVPVLPRTHFVLEAKLHKLVPHLNWSLIRHRSRHAALRVRTRCLHKAKLWCNGLVPPQRPLPCQGNALLLSYRCICRPMINPPFA